MSLNIFPSTSIQITHFEEASERVYEDSNYTLCCSVVRLVMSVNATIRNTVYI